jgi:hypothetical protein
MEGKSRVKTEGMGRGRETVALHWMVPAWKMVRKNETEDSREEEEGNEGE